MKNLVIFCFMLTLAGSCDQNGCARDQVCTEIFAMVVVEVKDTSGQPVALDSVKIENQEKAVYTTGDPGSYVIADDSFLADVAFDGTPFHFKGWLDAALVVDEEFLIGRDCCHIKKLEGPEEIVVDGKD